MHDKYILRYLPLFYDDLESILKYITEELHNRDAAVNLLNSVETAIKNRLPIAESFEQFHSRKERRYPYYRIYVENYIIFYVVIKENGLKCMEVRRIIYRGRDLFNSELI